MIETDAPFLYNETADVVRLFDDPPDVRLSFSLRGDVFENTVRAGGREFVYTERQPFSGEIEYKRYARRFAKIAVYETLSSLTGQTMPWGALTGIRPTKLAYAELEAGRDFVPLFEKCCVSEANIALIRRILEEQKGIYAKETGAADLYAGIAFCPSKCSYCSFITADITRTGKYADPYLCALEKEIASCEGLFNKLRSVYVGGGTPFALDEKGLERVLKALEPFARDVPEYTVEAGRPDVFTEGKLALLKEYGVDRICINPQSFNGETLRAIGRNHTVGQIYEAFSMAEKYGFSVNCDLIAGLPGETEKMFEKSVREAVALAPDNITVHTLCLKKGAKLKEEEQRLRGGEIGSMIAYSREALGTAGYAPYYLYRQKYMAGNYENTGWCRKGTACVYNVDVMEETCDNIACGANAVGKKIFHGEGRIERVGAPKDIATYIAKIDTIIAEKKKLFG